MENEGGASRAREEIEEAEAIAGGLAAIGEAEAAEGALEADDGFLAVRIRRAKEWREGPGKGAEPAARE